MNKQLLREVMLSKRFSLSKEIHKVLSEKALVLIRKHPLYISAKTVGLYHPIKGELDLTALITDDKIFALPRVENDSMVFDTFHQTTTLLKSQLDILESDDKEKLSQPLDLIIVPALAVDDRNHRVGYGKGFFDKFIKEHPTIKTLCVILDFQKVAHIDTHANDQTICDIIMIETEVNHDY